jgi:hypothetical protein
VAITRDQVSSVYTSAGTASAVVTWPTLPAAGSKVLVAIGLSSGGITSVKDNGTSVSTFVLDSPVETESNTIQVYRADGISLPSAGSYTVTVTLPSSQYVFGGGVSYWGVAAGGPTASNGGVNGGSASVATGSVTPARAGALFFAGFVDESSSNPETITLSGAGFSEQLTETNGSNVCGGIADQIAAGGPSSTACTWTLGDTPGWCAVIVSYDAAVAAPASLTQPGGQTWRRRYRPVVPTGIGVLSSSPASTAGAGAQVTVAGGTGTPLTTASVTDVAAAVAVAGGTGTPSGGTNNGVIAGTAASVTVAGGTGTPASAASITGTGASVTVAGGTGTAAGSAPVTGVAAQVTVAGGTGTPDASDGVAGAGAQVTVAGGTGSLIATGTVAGVAAQVTVAGGVGDVGQNQTGMPSPGTLPGNILTAEDSDFEVGGSFTWAADGLVLNSNPYFAGASSSGWTGYNGTLSVTGSPPAGAPYPYAAEFTLTSSGGAIEESAAPFSLISGNSYTVAAWVYTPETSVLLGFDWLNASHGYLSTSTQSISVPANTWTQVTATLAATPSGAAAAYPRIGPNTTGHTIYAESVIVLPGGLPGGLPASAQTIAVSTSFAFSGTHGLTWTASAAADSYIATGLYPCEAAASYDVSGYLITPAQGHDAYIGAAWYNAAGTLLGTSWGPDCLTPTADIWQPLYGAVTSPAGATQMKIIVWAGTSVVAGEQFAVDLLYGAPVVAQVLADWSNAAFAVSSPAGAAFADITPWVRWDTGITITRGRQDSISEIQAGQATFAVQNDTGMFTANNSGSLAAALMGNTELGSRCQVNAADQAGNWYTRFDGAVASIAYTVDTTGDTNLAAFTLADVMAYLNRQGGLECWTRELIQYAAPSLHWDLADGADSDTVVAGSDGVAAESSGFNGVALRSFGTSSASGSSLAWANTNGGVETLQNAAAPDQPDMSEYWPAGSVTGTGVNALDSGSAGPYTTPLPSVYFTPTLAAQSAQNLFTGNTGWSLRGQLDSTSLLATATGSYALEAWFAMDPAIGTAITSKYGPYVVLSLGSSRQMSCLVIGVYLTATQLLAQAATYTQPPWYDEAVSSTALQSVNTVIATDTVPLPHHLVANITGSSSGAELDLWVDGTQAGSITLPKGQVYDMVSVGAAIGGFGCFYGNIQLVSVYPRTLDPAEITLHCRSGQCGMWERPSDDCVDQLSRIAGIPGFWSGLSSQEYGLTLADYFDITNYTPLSAMQTYEQTEQGLLYVDATGMVRFATRDRRMGHGAPDLALAPDSYTADFSYQLIDQFLLNTATISTWTYTQGVTWVDQSSVQQYGSYSNGSSYTYSAGYITAVGAGESSGSGQNLTGVQLPLITWSRAYSELGLTPLVYWTSPDLDDNAAWSVNTRGTARLIYGSLTVDLLTLDPTTGLTITGLYGLEINDVIALSGTLPVSIANTYLANEMFIEGIQETISLDVRSIEFYTSPSVIQRAWIPGDPVYGVLGTTTRVGVSAPDLSQPQALGKDVSHDGGPPYWPPQFNGYLPPSVYEVVGPVATTGSSFTLSPVNGVASTVTGDTLIATVQTSAAVTLSASDTQSNTWTQIASATAGGARLYVLAAVNAQALGKSDTITITDSNGSLAYISNVIRITNVAGLDTVVSATGTSTAPSVSCGTLATAADAELVIVLDNATQPATIPAGWNYVNGNTVSGHTQYSTMIWRQATSYTGDIATGGFSSSTAWAALALTFTLVPAVLNNPADDGHQFIGGLEMRGLTEPLRTLAQPPMAGVNALSYQQSIGTGASPTPQVHWSGLNNDTASSMGALPGWPNWYVCTVPGFYILSGEVQYATHTSGETGTRLGYFAVCQKGAQAIAAGTGSPQAPASNYGYVCPVGEQHQPNDYGLNTVMSPSTRMYLGIGDCVALCTIHTQGSTELLGYNNSTGGSMMSVRWDGYSTADDQVMVNSVIGGAGTVSQGGGGSTGPTSPLTYILNWQSTGTYSYYGSTATNSLELRESNGNVYQGTNGHGGTGSMFSYVTFDWSAIQGQLSGATIKWAKLTATNGSSWYANGMVLMLGWSSQASFGSYITPATSTDHFNLQDISFKRHQNRNWGLEKVFWPQILSGITAFTVGNNKTTDLHEFGYFTPSWTLTIAYTG